MVEIIESTDLSKIGNQFRRKTIQDHDLETLKQSKNFLNELAI